MKRAIKSNLIFLWAFIIILTSVAFTKGIDGGLSVMKATVSTGILATIIYFIPFNEKAKGTLIVVIPAIASVTLSVLEGGMP